MNYRDHVRFMEFKHQGNFQGAVALLEPSLSGNLGNAEQRHSLHILTVFAVYEGYFDVALEYCSKLESIDPLSRVVPMNRWWIHRLKGNFDEALKYHQLSDDLTPPKERTDEYLFSHATGLAGTLYAANRLDECEALLVSTRLPYEYMVSGHMSGGERVGINFNTLLCARLHLKRGREPEAIECYRPVVADQCSPDWTPCDFAEFAALGEKHGAVIGDVVLTNEALLHARQLNTQGRFPEAIEYYRQAIRAENKRRVLSICPSELLDELASVIRRGNEIAALDH